MGDPGATRVIIFPVGMMDGESKLLTMGGSACGKKWGLMGEHDRESGAMGLEFHEPLPHRMERGRGMVFMINIPSKNKMYWGNLFFSFSYPYPKPSPQISSCFFSALMWKGGVILKCQKWLI